MSFKDKFTEAEWADVLQAPMLAGFAITAADPGGLVGAVRESAAMAGSLAQAMKSGAEGALVSEIAEAYKTPEGRDAARDGLKALVKGRKPAEACEAAVAKLGAVMASVERAAPEAAEAFRGFLMETAQKTAEASKEGGFMGIGGETISEAERKTLDQLRAALGAATA